MLQILANNTNAKTGRCEYTIPASTGASSQLIAKPIRECFSEFLPTSRLARLPRRRRDDVPPDGA